MGTRMKFKHILVVKETRHDEKRVALTPTVVTLLVKKGYRVLVEADAGLNAGFSNAEYAIAGAQLFSLGATGFPADTFIVRVLRPSKEREHMENRLFHERTAMLGFLFPFVADNHIATWQELGLTTLSFDLFKSISVHDPKNAQAAMSRIAGRLAFLDAYTHYTGTTPKLTVIGTGPAALSAAFEALKHKIPVQIFGRQEKYRAELERLGITYFVLPSAEKQIAFIRPHLSAATLVVTAARSPGKKAPLLIDEESIRCLPSSAVVVDLAVSNGGNVSGSRSDNVVTTAHGVTIRNVSGYPKMKPKTSSEAYAQCAYHLITEIMSPQGEVSFENKLVQELWVTHNTQRHDALYDTFDSSETNNTMIRAKL